MEPLRTRFTLCLLFFGILCHPIFAFRSGLNTIPGERSLSPCPTACLDTGSDPSAWDIFATASELDKCQQPVLFDFGIHGPLTRNPKRVRACTVWGGDFYHPSGSNTTGVDEASRSSTIETVNVELAWWGTVSVPGDEDDAAADGASALRSAQQYLKDQSAIRGNLAFFASTRTATVGVYVGHGHVPSEVAKKLLGPLAGRILTQGLPDAAAVQLCGTGRDSSSTLGIVVSTDISKAQQAVRSWSGGSCVDEPTGSLDLQDIPLGTKPRLDASIASRSTTEHAQESLAMMNHPRSLSRLPKRAECSTIAVEPDNYCSMLADKCGATDEDFLKWNPDPDFCSTIVPGQLVCCSAGELPDLRQSKNSDGSCAVYETVALDSCATIAVRHGLTQDELERYNEETWGWNGCDSMWVGVRLCVSEGDPPFPLPIANALCGPQVPGTSPPERGEDIAQLNACPLNACCNIWGQCGTNDDFCIEAKGTIEERAKVLNRCISNCGNEIIKGSAPSSFMKLGYFEGFNLGRECLNMDAIQIPKDYTHIHFAFVDLTPEYGVTMADPLVDFQFKQFKKITTAKRIAAFGGWSFSTEPASYTILRAGTHPENAEKLATSIANFITEHNLDGVDIDWEYPGAPDINVDDPGDADEGENYLGFLRMLRGMLPGKSVSIAAPASYWYLKQFPIAEIGKVVDYMVYMTYDLHGQWDSGNQWSSTGCIDGNCLRSHVNKTETIGALSMITKAGVPSNKILVGLSSYGRSFRMAAAGCTGPDCAFIGSPTASDARPGRCTDTGGYLADAEIQEIMDNNVNIKTWVDKDSDSNIMVYDDVEWVAWMDEETKKGREELYRSYNFAGTCDWALDLQAFVDPPVYTDIDTAGGAGLVPWVGVKLNVQRSGAPTCDLAHRSVSKEGSWVDIQCTLPQVTSPGRYLPRERWEAVHGDDAWEDTMFRWRNCDRGSGNHTFSESVSMFLHQTENPKCELVKGDTNCVVAKCEAHNTPDVAPEDMTGAASYMVWNSIVTVVQYARSSFDAFRTVGEDVVKSSNEFITVFSPKPQDFSGLNMLLDMLAIPVAGGGAMFFKHMFGKLLSRDEVLTDVAKDMTNAMIAAGFSALKVPDPDEVDKEMAFNAILKKTIDAWSVQARDFLELLFSGDDKFIDTLSILVKQGKLIAGSRNGELKDGGQPEDIFTTFQKEEAAKRAFYGIAVPTVWKETDQFPAVIDGGTCKGKDAIKDITSGSTYYCYRDRAYFLVAAPKDSRGTVCVPPEVRTIDPCSNRPLGVPRGVPQLDGKKWGEVTWQDIIAGSVETYRKRGNKNGDKMEINPQDKTFQDALYEDNIRAPGMIQLPVCSAEEAYSNWVDGRAVKQGKFYPCNS